MSDWRFIFREHKATLLAFVVFIVMFGVYVANHPAGLTANVANTAANKAVLLALVAMAQTLPVLTGGLDLSVGMVFVLANCVASAVVVDTPMQTAFGIVLVVLLGLACGAVNGAIVVYGRLQPIITTLATGAVYYGLALWLRPVPGGAVNYGLADTLTGKLRDAIPGMTSDGPLGSTIGATPVTLLVLLVVVLVVWVPYRRSVIGRAAFAIGSSEQAAYMSGVPIRRAKLLAYTLSGLLAAIGGLFLTFLTYSGEASAPIGGTYTLNSIAAVVIGGTSLFGGVGSAIGSIFGAFVLRTIGDLLFVFDMDPLWQPLFQGVILLVAVSLGSIRLLQIRNRLELFG
jgi:ribose transport system permease protein